MKNIPLDSSGGAQCKWAPEVHLNLNVRGLLPSATAAINELSNRLIAEGS